jgi:hypothetical protein
VFESRMARSIFGSKEMKKQEGGKNYVSKRFLMSTFHVLLGRSEERDEMKCSTREGI